MTIKIFNRLVPASIVLGIAGLAHAQTSFTPLGDLPGGTVSGRGLGIAPSGTMVVGVGNDGADAAAYWRNVGGAWIAPVGLPRLASGMAANARACASNWSTLFGDANDAAGFAQAVRWPQGGVAAIVVPLGYPAAGGYSGVAYACRADGNVACGENIYQPPGNGGPPPLPITQAFRWTSADMVDI